MARARGSAPQPLRSETPATDAPGAVLTSVRQVRSILNLQPEAIELFEKVRLCQGAQILASRRPRRTHAFRVDSLPLTLSLSASSAHGHRPCRWPLPLSDPQRA